MTKFQVRKAVSYFKSLRGSLFSTILKVDSRVGYVRIYFARIVPGVFIEEVSRYCECNGLIYFVSIDLSGKLYVCVHD